MNLKHGGYVRSYGSPCGISNIPKKYQFEKSLLPVVVFRYLLLWLKGKVCLSLIDLPRMFPYCGFVRLKIIRFGSIVVAL